MASEQEAAGVEVEGEVNSEETSVMSRDSRLGAFIQSLIEKRGLLLNERKWQGSYTESSVLDAGRRSIQGLRFEECHLLTQSMSRRVIIPRFIFYISRPRTNNHSARGTMTLSLALVHNVSVILAPAAANVALPMTLIHGTSPACFHPPSISHP